MNARRTATVESIKIAVIVAGFGLVAGLVAVDYLRKSGGFPGSAHRQALELVWPNLMDLPASDRAVLVALAKACDLELRAKAAGGARHGQVVRCLQDAAAASGPPLPSGVSPNAARSTLARLLDEAR